VECVGGKADVNINETESLEGNVPATEKPKSQTNSTCNKENNHCKLNKQCKRVKAKLLMEDQTNYGKAYNAFHLQEFLTSKLLPLKHKWLHVLHMAHLGMGETTTIRAEVTNSTMKFLWTDKVQPSLSLDSSVGTMSRQSNVSVKQKQKAAMQDANRQPLWMNSETAKDVIEPACRMSGTRADMSLTQLLCCAG
jgi:transcriptional regulator of aromatic amino acid metabolism